MGTRLIAVSGVAGSGKTTYAFNKATEICDEERIRAIALTNELVYDLRNRYPKIYISTIHSFANRLWNSVKESSSVIDELTKMFFYKSKGVEYKISKKFKDILLEADGNKIDYIKRYILNNKFKYIGDLKENEVMEIIRKMKNSLGLALRERKIYETLIDYENWLEENYYIDFDYMLLRVVAERIVPEWEKYRVLIWDEANDSMPLVVKLIQTVSKAFDFLIMNGDPAQTIYDTLFFSNPKNFTDLFEKADEQIILDKTNRMPENIVKFVNSYYLKIPKDERIIDEIKTEKKGGFTTEKTINYLYKISKSILRTGSLNFREMPTIVTLSNHHIEQLRRILDFWGCPYIVKAGYLHEQWTEEMLGFRNLLYCIKEGKITENFSRWVRIGMRVCPELNEYFRDKLRVRYEFPNWRYILDKSIFNQKQKRLIEKSLSNYNFEIKTFIKLTTVHSAKGEEFLITIVYIRPTIHLLRFGWMTKVKDYYNRVLYTALSRAVKVLIALR